MPAHKTRPVTQRIDLFHEPGLWAAGTQLSWMSQPLLARAVKSGHALPTRGATADPSEALDRMLARQRERRLQELACVFAYKTITNAQLIELLGRPVDLSDAFRAGLVQRGRDWDRRMTAWRPTDSDMWSTLLSRLDFTERMSMTAGMPVGVSAQHDRHNLLSVQFGLAAATGSPAVEAVLGTSLSGHTALTRSVAKSESAAADLTLVRSDGLRIAIETTASHTPAAFTAKVRRWARELSAPGVSTCVLFVEAALPNTGRANAADRTIRSAIDDAVRSAGIGSTVADRMAIARWVDYFPAAGVVSNAFRALRAERPTGTREHRWEQADLLNHGDVDGPKSGTDALSLIANAWDLWQTPTVLKPAGHTVDFTTALLRQLGLDRLPEMEPAPR